MKNPMVANIKKNAELLLLRKVYGDHNVMMFWSVSAKEGRQIMEAMQNSGWIHQNTIHTDDGEVYILYARATS